MNIFAMKPKTQITTVCSYIMHAWRRHVGQAPDEILRNCQFLVTFLWSTQLCIYSIASFQICSGNMKYLKAYS